MPYLLEQLNDETFQHLCQALIVKSFPDAQCLPVNQPDGGRDSFLRKSDRSQKELVVFQVKFSRRPQSKDERDVIDSLVSTETSKVEELIKRGATRYILLTNVAGTSHLDSGSIDRVNKKLSEEFRLPAFCWWRDDIERRIDGEADIKWSYPEILRSSDILQQLAQAGDRLRSEAISRTLRAYMTYQYTRDSKLKFKQIELQTDIEKQFVDVPCEVVLSQNEKERSIWAKTLNPSFVDEVLSKERHKSGSGAYSERYLSTAFKTLSLLLTLNVMRGFPRIVIEGAPGQGKSTVTQFLCQIHRQALLGRDRDQTQIRSPETRFPFRVDLRDYASWILGRDPFSDDPEARLPDGTNPSLETYLVAQIKRYSACEFTTDDLLYILPTMRVIIVLDGFDEVAEVTTRNRIVDEITQASDRLETFSESFQIIVTSRPAAFANSPGFPQNNWQHIQLLSLSRELIDEYTTKWLDGRDADARERRDVSEVLSEKLSQSHIRQLARNPMQLAILLALLATQGTSLPDRRTVLYDDYIRIFFNREAEKSAIVRTYRDLIIRVHWFLAYRMQAEAEANSGNGRLAEANLKEVIKSHLDQKHGSPDIEVFFKGMRERVGALVSRVQGTFEFEVQPLREYFAAKFLYDTAPISKSGAEKSGSLPDRFLAIARNAYWLNVTRFYAGCYNSGELASLVEGLDELATDRDLRYAAHLNWLSVFLLTDYVFDPQPRLGSRVVDGILLQPNLSIILSQNPRLGNVRDLVLPAEFGQEQLFSKCCEMLKHPLSRSSASVIGQTAVTNSTARQLVDFWHEIKETNAPNDHLITVANVINIHAHLSAEECAADLVRFGYAMLSTIMESDRLDAISLVPAPAPLMITSVLDGGFFFFQSRRSLEGRDDLIALSQIGYLSSPFILYSVINDVDADSVESSVNRMIMHRGGIPSLKEWNSTFPEQLLSLPVQNAVQDLMRNKPKERQEMATALCRLAEELNHCFGLSWTVCLLAIAHCITSDCEAVESVELKDENRSICTRVAYARQNNQEAGWWKRQADACLDCDQNYIMLLIKCAVECQLQDTLVSLIATYRELISKLEEHAFDRLLFSLDDHEYEPMGSGDPRSSVRVFAFSVVDVERMCPRVAAVIFKIADLATRDLLFETVLCDYSGGDRSIIEICGDWVWFGKPGKERDWDKILNFASSGYGLGASEFLVRDPESDASEDMPYAIAERVCAHANDFPLSIVSIAERKISGHLSSKVRPVSEIAKLEGWTHS